MKLQGRTAAAGPGSTHHALAAHAPRLHRPRHRQQPHPQDHHSSSKSSSSSSSSSSRHESSSRSSTSSSSSRGRQRSALRAAAPACASGARALPSVTCHTIVKLATPEDLQLVLMGNDLVAEVFYSTSPNPMLDAIAFNSYRLRSAAQTLGLHMGSCRSHASIVALSGSSSGGGGSTAGSSGDGGSSRGVEQQQQQQQQPWLQEGTKAIGVVNVSLMAASPAIATAAACPPGTPFAMITNMAVAPTARRRGIAHALMQAAVRAALVDLDACPSFALLLAYKYYEPAMRLYESWGFTSTPWVDPAWQEDAEKGRAVRQRRIMLVKQLSGTGLGVGVGLQQQS